MARYAYKAVDRSGHERSGSLAASSSDQAGARLGARGWHLLSLDLEPDRPLAVAGRITLGRRHLNASELAQVTRQLAEIAQVTPLAEALRLVGRQSERAHVRAVIGDVEAAVSEGKRLADGLARAPRSFSSLYRAMVAAGEASGSLADILERLAQLLERQAAMRGKIITAIAYPLVLALVAMGVVSALMIFVVPKVVEQFDTVGQQLPALTRFVIALSTFLAGWWWALLIGLAVLALAFARAMTHPGLRLKWDGLLLRLPFFGRLLRDLHAARMARTLATMVASRLPLLDGLTLTSQTIGNHVLRQATERVAERVRTGGSLSGALRAAAIFPPVLVYLAAGGETSGRLDIMLARAADTLEREFDLFTSTLLSLLEPLIIIVMGAVVAAIILAILMPILQLQTLTAI